MGRGAERSEAGHLSPADQGRPAAMPSREAKSFFHICRASGRILNRIKSSAMPTELSSDSALVAAIKLSERIIMIFEADSGAVHCQWALSQQSLTELTPAQIIEVAPALSSFKKSPTNCGLHTLRESQGVTELKHLLDTECIPWYSARSWKAQELLPSGRAVLISEGELAVLQLMRGGEAVSLSDV